MAYLCVLYDPPASLNLRAGKVCWNSGVWTACSLNVKKLATIYTVAPKAKPTEVRGRIPTK